MTERTSHRPWPLVVRRARPGDEAQVVAFSTDTWNGWDYMPRAWPRWMDAQDGVMLVGAVGGSGGLDVDGRPLQPGQVVAVVRVAMPAAGEAWWEGIRVDPRVRGMDVATDLQVGEFAWSAANGARIVRYATSARNEGSHRLGARGGLEHIVSFLGVSHGPDEESRSGFDLDTLNAAQAIRDGILGRLTDAGVIESSPARAQQMWAGVSGDVTFNAGHRLYEPRPWALEELTEGKFLNHVARGEVLHASDDNGKAVAILTREVVPAEDATTRLALVAGVPATAFGLVEQVRRAANDTLRFRYPEGAPLVDDVRDDYANAGYDMSDWAMHIMARPLDDEHPPLPVDPAQVILEDPPAAVIRPPR